MPIIIQSCFHIQTLPSSIQPTFPPMTAVVCENSAFVWTEWVISNSSLTNDVQTCVRISTFLPHSVKLRAVVPFPTLRHHFFCTEDKPPVSLASNHGCWKQMPKREFWVRQSSEKHQLWRSLPPCITRARRRPGANHIHSSQVWRSQLLSLSFHLDDLHLSPVAVLSRSHWCVRVSQEPM